MNLLFLFEFLVITCLQLYYKPNAKKNQGFFSTLKPRVLKNVQKKPLFSCDAVTI